MDYAVRSGDRETLIETLDQFAQDRGGRGKSERADDARRAAQALRDGADGAHFERIIYVPGENDRYSVISGTRDEVEAQLRDSDVGFLHLGSPETAAEARAALERVAAGAEVVRVGHLLYAVRV
jgi:hypothetical protein